MQFKIDASTFSLICLATISLSHAADALPIQPIAHRGLLMHSPENTLANFTACQQLRLGFEFDVRRSKDGTLVCVHDDTVDRTTNGKGLVTAKTLAELKELDAGSWFNAAFRGEQIPTIDEVFRVIAAYPSKATLFTADLKGEDELLEQDILQLADKHQVSSQILFIGRAIDHPEVRARLRQADPKCHVAALAQAAADVERAIADKNSDWVYLRFVPDAATIASIHKTGKRSIIAGVKVSGVEKENWAQSTAAGINAMLTDYPLEFRTQLKQKPK